MTSKAFVCMVACAISGLAFSSESWFDAVAEFPSNWSATSGEVADLAEKQGDVIEVNADAANLLYTPRAVENMGTKTITTQAAFGSSYLTVEEIPVEEGAQVGIAAVDGESGTVFAVYNGTEWVATEVAVDVNETVTITTTIDAEKVVYKTGGTLIATVTKANYTPQAIGFSGSGTVAALAGAYEQADPIPAVIPADDAAVAEIVATFADTALADIVKTPAEYTVFQTWAHSIAGKTTADVAESKLAAKSFEMRAISEAHLFAEEPKIEIEEVTVGETLTATVKITDGEDLVAAVEAIASKVQVSTDLTAWDKATATAWIEKDGIAHITINKPEGKVGFIKVNTATAAVQ